MNLRHHISTLDRYSWALRLIGLAYLVLFTSWFISDADLIVASVPHGIFHDQAQSLSKGFQATFLLLGLLASISLIASRLIKLALSLCVISLIALLGQLPSELIHSADRFLITLSLLLLVTPGKRDTLSTSIRAYALSALVALWAWSNLYFIYQHASPLWTRLHFFNFWAWTDAAPTPLALTLASSSIWLRKIMSALLISAFAFAPIVIILKNRLWPLAWLSLGLLFSLGSGLPSWIGLLLVFVFLIACDQRWPNGIDHKLSQYIPLQHLSSLALLSWPVFILTAWMSLSNHLGIIPFLVISVYLMCSSLHYEHKNDDAQEHRHLEIGKGIRFLIPSMLILVFLSLNMLGFTKIVRTYLPQASAWQWTKADNQWTISPMERSSLIIERSEDGGGAWLKEDHVSLDRVTLKKQPWRPFHPLREEHWFQQIARSEECVEGPFMELFERRLKFHIKRLNTPPLQTAGQLILLRARRVHWVRSAYQFWREEAKGFFCITTNLPVLLKARALVQKSRKELPKMPTLDPSHKPK